MMIRRNTLLLLLVLFLFGNSGCSNLTPTENGLLAAGAVGAATGVALGTTVSPSISIPVAIGSALLAGGGAYLYSKNRATIDQRRIAEARARLYYAKLNESEQENTNRYLAVNAPNTAQTQGQAVMLYDTQTKTMPNDVYDMKKTPSVGASTSIGNNRATYIGSGN
ncbi:MAG: hypothetical protein DVB29_01550 [Verrucomicrobia bacterium]|jgi:hypothetical protein|nr:MAG: hypothetical protein DVB29_01550 [Verrucomicrobiota bacterium]MDH4470539.1 hypothetical protein [Verrucomicrobiae bacterium]